MREPQWVRSVARIWKGSSYASESFRGSGFQITPHCLLTAKHVVGRFENDLFVTGASWTGVRKVIKTVNHESRDIALLYVDGSLGSHGWLLRPRMELFNLGPELLRGTLAGYADHRTDIHLREAAWQSFYGLTNALALSTPVAHGMSGGPFVVGGRAAGVIQGRDEEKAVTYIIPLSAISDFLRLYVGDELADTPQLDETGSRIFVQVLNPEILRLYGLNADIKLIGDAISIYFRYAFLFATDCVIMPASYLFELDGLSDILRPIEPLLRNGMLQLANPTLSLDGYFELKQKREYRDRPNYGSLPEVVSATSIPIIPRVWRSTANDIAQSWKTGVGDPSSWFSTIFDRLTREGHTAQSIEYRFANLPALLDNRAFIQEFVERELRVSLLPHERSQLAFFLSREYLLSYLQEYRAFILNDTAMGRLDCGLNRRTVDGQRLTLSLRQINALFDRLGIRSLFERSLSWDGLRSLRSHPTASRFVEVILGDVHPSAGVVRPNDETQLRVPDDGVVDAILGAMEVYLK
ncbi:MAG TPA: serine protease [Rhodopseudomonas sp.]|uniref:S1 family peptidase n=1 Tax=Rhodopseudomonas sp. TaxID=1078 RepID=UPI002ED9C747